MFTVSAFIPGTTQAITGTQDGDVIVWDHQGVSAEIGTRHTDRKAIKIMRLHNASLTWLSTISNFVITGADDGHVRFFDPMLRLIAWFEHIDAGPVKAVSFSHACPALPSVPAFDTFLCPDFLVGSSRGAIMLMTANAFNTAHEEHRRGKQVMHGLVGELVACCAHPLQVWDAIRCTLLLSTQLDLGGAQLSCSTYARSGAAVVVGATNGAVMILKGDDLSIVERFKNSRTTITAVSISSKAQHIAAATADGYVQLMFLVPHKTSFRWEFVGRAKVHYSPIIAVHFGEAPSGETRCFSLSEDGRLAEYDINASSLEAGVLVGNQVSACPQATPTAMCFTPPIAYFQRGVIDTHLVIADSSYHMRVFNPDNAVTSGTYRSPTCGHPLAQMVMFQAADTTLIAFRWVP
jgi:cilia- and flagella-associated protein 251